MPSYHSREFSKQALNYTKHNIIQKVVVKNLIKNIHSKPKTVLDLGSGSGAVYAEITWKIEKFTAIDSATHMCSLHPINSKIDLINEDFETSTFKHHDIIISSSALQWAKNLDLLFQKIVTNCNEMAFAIFCDETFKTIYELTKLKSILPNKHELLKLLNSYFTFDYEVVNYKLNFKDNISKFRYIKNSGVSGGERKLNFKETKELIDNYPHNYLEFEVMFIWGKPKYFR